MSVPVSDQQSQILSPDIAELCDLVHGDGDFAMLKAYFDESGIHSSSPVCVVAGFVTTKAGASQLSSAWQNLLYEFKVPYFHAREFVKRTDAFKTWHDPLARQFEIEAVSVINDLPEATIIGCAVLTADFKKLTRDERRWLTGGVQSRPGKWRKQGAPDKPYFLAFQQVVLDAVKYTQDTDFHGRHTGKGKVVHFVFDQQQEYKPTALALFHALRVAKTLSIKGRVGDAVFSSKLRAIPLQVADFIAYESFVHVIDRLRHRIRVFDEGTRSARLFNRRTRSVMIDAGELRQLLEYCPIKPHARFHPPDPIDDRIATGSVKWRPML